MKTVEKARTVASIFKISCYNPQRTYKLTSLFQQLKIIHDNGYSEKEALNKRELVYVNVVQAMNFVLEGRRKLRVPFEHPSSEVCVQESQ